MKRVCVCAAILVFSLMAGPAGATDQGFSLIEVRDQAEIDWSRRLVRARGTAGPGEVTGASVLNRQHRLVDMARHRAETRLMSLIEALPLDSRQSAGAVLASSRDSLDQLTVMIGQARTVQKDYLTDGSVEMMIEMPFDGGFAQLLLPGEIQQIQPLKTVTPVRNPSSPENPIAAEESYTGLVVDTRGLTVRPVLSPRVIDEGGQEIYGPAYVSREHAVQSGTVYYTRSLDDPLLIERTGSRPVIVTGLKVQGTCPADVIISRADASKLHSSPALLGFLGRGRVAVVVDVVSPTTK
ncbi:hypothetical protein JCM14469_33750 [Desulfatiferula olefinivorans]